MQESKYGIIAGRMNGINKRSQWRPHSPASKIKKEIGPELFDSYYKFSAVRNPWDRAVSLFWFVGGRELEANKFADAKTLFKLFSKKHASELNNWELHTIDDKPVCDFYIKYENLHNDIAVVFDKLQLGRFDSKSLPKFKTSYRKFNNKYQDYYDEEMVEFIRKLYSKDIDYFGYKF